MIRITSPHLMIYQPQLNSFNSVMMRVSGGCLFALLAVFVFLELFANVRNAFSIGSYISILVDSVLMPYLVSALLLLVIFHFVFSIGHVNQVISFVRPIIYTDTDEFSIEDFEFLMYCKIVVTVVLYIAFLGFMYY
uniref:Succinate dehydrogenase subunit 3 n=1 Tax=Tsukubamonas globosa TaxID=875863 RepID=W8VRC6_9EUKA|nr:succinate dehydrogenase subunit 3 [Tsukubamonas globosa]BAO51989.1 succinate dehydrogenase subunit 3 [Tsukubamonas globosa]